MQVYAENEFSDILEREFKDTLEKQRWRGCQVNKLPYSRVLQPYVEKLFKTRGRGQVEITQPAAILFVLEAFDCFGVKKKHAC